MSPNRAGGTGTSLLSCSSCRAPLTHGSSWSTSKLCEPSFVGFPNLASLSIEWTTDAWLMRACADGKVPEYQE